MKEFELQIVTPERMQASLQATEVIVPTLSGDLGVLPHHAPLLTTLRPGVVSVYEKGALTNRLFVTGGLGEISHNRCILLVTEAVSVDTFSQETLSASLQEVSDKIAHAHKDSDALASLREEEALLRAKLSALTVYYH